MKKERFAIVAITVLLLLGVGYIGLASYLEAQRGQMLELTRPSDALERYEELGKRIQSPQGVDTSTDSTPAPSPAVDDARYAHETIRQYGDLFQQHEDNRETSERLMLLTQQLDRVGLDGLAPEELDELKQLLELDSEFLNQVRATAQRGGPSFPLELENGFKTLMPHLSPMRDFARRLGASARLNAEAGDYAAATEDILAILNLAESVQEEPVLISQYLAWVMYGSAIYAVHRDFDPGSLPPDLAARITAHASTTFDGSAIAEALRMEQHFMVSHITDDDSESWPDRREYIEGGSILTRIARQAYDSPFMSPWRDWDAMTYSNLMDDFIETAQDPYYEAAANLEAVQEDFENVSDFMVATRSSIPAVQHIAQSRARIQAQLDLMAIGLAIEGHAFEAGALPVSLNELSIPIPNDPHTGESYVYQIEGDGFLLYSIGQDGVDNGGVHDLTAGDIVWRGKAPKKKSEEKKAKVASAID